MVRQGPQHAGFPGWSFGPLRSMAIGHGLPVLLRLRRRRDGSVDAVPLARSYADLSMAQQAGLQPDYRPGRRSDQVYARTERLGTRPAVLPLLRSRGNPCAAPAYERMERQIQG